MATNFRPVKETWGSGSPTHGKPFELESVLDELGELAFCGNVETSDYAEVRSMYFEEGQKLIDYLDAKTEDELVDALLPVLEDKEALHSIIRNLKNKSAYLQSFIADGGELVFYIDAY